MSYTLQKLTKLLLVFVLVATPLHASWGGGEAMGELAVLQDVPAKVLMDDAGISACCCIADDCFMQGCDQCNTFTPVVLVLKIKLPEARQRVVSTPYRKEFYNRQLSPPRQPPRV